MGSKLFDISILSRFDSIGRRRVSQYDKVADDKITQRNDYLQDQQNRAAWTELYVLEKRLCCQITIVYPGRWKTFHLCRFFSNYPYIEFLPLLRLHVDSLNDTQTKFILLRDIKFKLCVFDAKQYLVFLFSKRSFVPLLIYMVRFLFK